MTINNFYSRDSGISGPMILHKCLALNPIESAFFSQNLIKKIPEKHLRNLREFRIFIKFCEKKADSTKFTKRMQVAKASHLCRTIGSLF